MLLYNEIFSFCSTLFLIQGNRIGRRLANALSFFMCAVFCVPAIFTVHCKLKSII